MKLSRPSRWGAICFIIALFIFLVDLSELLTQSLVVIPIYRTGTLYFLWSDYVMVTFPVGCVWLGLSYGFWNGGSS